MKTFIITFALVGIAAWATAQSSAIQVAQQGTGHPIIFLPGFASPASVWAETVRHLKGKHAYHLVSYAGFNSIAPTDTPWYQNVRKELFSYVEKHNLTHLTLIGHSMGGNLATELAAAFPDRVAKLIIVDATPCMRELMLPGVDPQYIRYDSPQVVRMLQMSEDSLRYTARMTAENMTSIPAKADTLVHWIMQADRKTYVYGYTDLLKMDLRPLLSQITAETLILGAPFPDKEVVTHNYEEQYANLASKTIRIAPPSKHFIMFDQPEWFYEQVNALLAHE